MPGSLAETIYYASPIWMQNLAFSLKGAQLRFRRYNKYFKQRLAELKESQHWDAGKILTYKNERLVELLRHCHNTVPFYKRLWAEHGVNLSQIQTIDDLPTLPALSKQTAREVQDQLVSTVYPPTSLIKLLTSGTTGTPLCVRQTREIVGFQWAVWWRHRARFGLKFGDRHLMFGARVPIPADQKSPPFWRHDWAIHRTYLSTYHMTPANLPAICDYLDTQDFAFYTGYPSAMYVLANYLSETGRTLKRKPRVVVTGSDALLPHFEAKMREQFCPTITETWGMTEFAGNMSKCEHGRFHEDFEIGHIESIPVPGTDVVKLVCTGWANLAMPFIRYEVGDYGRVTDTPCPCGRQSKSFLSVDGRTEDYIRTPDGRMGIGMNQVLEYAPNAREIQLFQERLDEVIVKFVPGAKWAKQTDEDPITLELRRRLGNDIRITFQPVEKIERTKSGKFRAVVSTLGAASQGEQELRKAME
jgi:phenylacetate-CoA ligase